MKNVFTRTRLVLLSVGIFLWNVTCSEAVPEPASLDELRRTYVNDALSDETVVRVLIEDLDRRLADFSAKPGTTADRDLPLILVMLGQSNSRTRTEERQRNLESWIHSLPKKEGVKNGEQLRLLLNMSLALSGGRASATDLLKVLTDPGSSNEILMLVLDGMARTSVPPEAIPRLKSLSQDPLSFVVANDVGPMNPRRVYPLRDRAYECLVRAGVKVRKEHKKDAGPDPVWGVTLEETVVTTEEP